jgi:hypothetical protein
LQAIVDKAASEAGKIGEARAVAVSACPVKAKSPLTTAVNGLYEERETGLGPATSSLGSNKLSVVSESSKRLAPTPSLVCTRVCTSEAKKANAATPDGCQGDEGEGIARRTVLTIVPGVDVEAVCARVCEEGTRTGLAAGAGDASAKDHGDAAQRGPEVAVYAAGTRGKPQLPHGVLLDPLPLDALPGAASGVQAEELPRARRGQHKVGPCRQR